MNKQIIELSRVAYRWNRKSELISFPDLVIHANGHLFIQGASGSGKTTLLNLLSGIIVPTQGRIEVLNRDLSKLSPFDRDRLRADHLGIIFQQFNLIPYLTVYENIELSTWFSRSKKKKLTNEKISSTVSKLIEQLNLGAVWQSPVAKLSVGQQQRVAIARALLGDPEIILADEPTSALDEENRNQFMDLLFEHVERHRATLIFVSHDDRLGHFFSHRLKI